MPLFLAPVLNSQIVDANGDPNTGGLVETYLAGSSTPVAVFTTDSGTTPHTNPIVLNSLGWPTLGAVWLTGGISYKFVIKDALGVTLRTIDNVSGVNDASVSQSEWVESGFTPTYIDATSFSVPGDQTNILQVGRRLRTQNTSGFIYSTIEQSVFAAGITTVTVANDSGVLDAGLSTVAYGVLSSTSSSVPAIDVTRFTTSTSRILGRATAGDGPVEELTVAQTTALLRSSTAQAQGGTDNDTLLTPLRLKEAQIQLGTAVTLTNQTSVDFTGIPSWVKRITMMFSGVSTNGTSNPIIQIGDAGGIENTGYQGASTSMDTGVATTNFTTGFGIRSSLAASVFHGTMVIEKLTGNTWVASGYFGASNAAFCILSGGSKTLSDVLDRIRFTTVGGTDQGDAGSINVSWE